MEPGCGVGWLPKEAGIYYIQNIVTGKRYVGSAKSLHDRYKWHVRDLEKNKHHSIKLQRAWNKYGADKFCFVVVKFVSDLDTIYEHEQSFMDLYKCVDNGYNICPTAGSRLGQKFSDETKLKMSLSQKGKPRPTSSYKRSDETKARMSLAQRSFKHATGYKFSETAKQNMRGPKAPEHAANVRAMLIERNKTLSARLSRERNCVLKYLETVELFDNIPIPTE